MSAPALRRLITGGGVQPLPWFVLAGLICGYGFAWLGHFVFEGNRPASFKRPLYSFMGDWVMYATMWRQELWDYPRSGWRRDTLTFR